MKHRHRSDATLVPEDADHTRLKVVKTLSCDNNTTNPLSTVDDLLSVSTGMLEQRVFISISLFHSLITHGFATQSGEPGTFGSISAKLHLVSFCEPTVPCLRTSG